MKYLRLFSIIFLLAAFTACSEDALEKSPTTAVSGTSMFETASAALVPLNGIYAAMHKPGWTAGTNSPHNWIVRANWLAADLMGDDMIIFTRGSGYFWRDHVYTQKERWTTTDRQYSVW